PLTVYSLQVPPARVTKRMNRFSRMLVLAALAAVPLLAGAHASLKSSAPAQGSRVTSPSKLEMHFSDTVQLKSVTLARKGDAAARPVKPLPEEWGSHFSLPLEPLQAGDYEVTWTVDTDDGHAATGKIRFTVVAAGGE